MDRASYQQGTQTVEEIIQLLEQTPVGVPVDPRAIAAMLRAARPSAAPSPPQLMLSTPDPAEAIVRTSWRERLWTCDAATRLSLAEAAEALNRSTSWVYKLTAAREIPFRRDGEAGNIEFVAGELREWKVEREITVVSHDAQQSPRAA